MSNLIKSFLRRKEVAADEAEAIARANQALKNRLEHYLETTHDRYAA